MPRNATQTPSDTGRRMLRASDARAERLIAVLRMVLSAALFGGVCMLLAQLDAAALSTRYVELLWLLTGASAYFLLGLVNFYLSHPRRFRAWQSWLFNALEIAILGFQLYIDVRDPGTPSLLALASPLVLVAALVLAVQALRFRLELHIFTTITLIGTCLVVTLYAPMTRQPWPASVMQEMQVLFSIPPNVMRLVILTTLGLVIGTAVYRARSLVLAVATEVEAAENLRRFLPSELGNRLSDAALADLRQPKLREVVVLMLDLRGFTALTEQLGPQEVAARLSLFRSSVQDASEAHGGAVDKFVGDGAMVVFGLHSDRHSAAHGALAAFAAIDRAMRGVEGGMRLAAGLHAGPALIGAFGDARRLEFTALGQTVNVASRLEEFAKAEGLTLALSRGSLGPDAAAPETAKHYGQIHVRGVTAPIDVLGLPGRAD